MKTKEEYIFYDHEGVFYPIPTWAHFFINLGSKISEIDGSGFNITVAIAVPTRAFVAAFIGLGITVARTINTKDNASPDYRLIRELKANHRQSEIIVREGNKKVKRIFCGIRDDFDDGIPRIGIRDPNAKGGSLTTYVTLEKCEFTNVASGDSMLTIYRSTSSGNPLTDRFIKNLIPEDRLESFNSKSVLNFLLVGQINTLRKELTELVFAVIKHNGEGNIPPTSADTFRRNPADMRFAEGTLQDILRVKRLSAARQIFKSEVLPTEARSLHRNLEDLQTDIVIFDGARSYLKWHAAIPGNKRIVILDVGESSFKDALPIINEDYMGSSENLTLGDLSIPEGIEVTAYTEAK